MIDTCFTCLPPATGLSALEQPMRGRLPIEQRPRWGRRMPPPPWCPDPVNRPGRGLSAAALPSNPYRTVFTPNQRTWMAESQDMFYGLDGMTPLEAKTAVALIGAALLGAALWFSR